jgi:predicted ATPase
VIGSSLLFRGEFASAREHFDRSLTLFSTADDAFYATLAAQDTRVGIFCFLATTLCYLGWLDQSDALIAKALTRARQLSHPYSLAYALVLAGGIHYGLGEPELLVRTAEEADAITASHGFPYLRLLAGIFRGWCSSVAGQTNDGIRVLQGGMDVLQSTGALIGLPLYGSMLASALVLAGQPEGALGQIERMRVHSQATRERWYDAELCRQRGSILNGLSHLVEAEACFRKSIRIAQRQGAKLWELRAATSLARLWRDQGKCTAAHELLAPVYGWFTEGFGTPVLQEAKAFLQELAA